MNESFKLYRRLLAWIRPYWRVVLISILAMAAAAPLGAAMYGLLKPLLDEGLIARNAEAMWRVPLLMVVAALGKGIADYVANVSSQWVANKSIEDLRRAVFEHRTTA